MINSLFFLAALLFLSFRMFPLEKEKKSFSVLLLLCGVFLLPAWYFNLLLPGWFLVLITVDLYLLFYAKEYDHLVKWCIGEVVIFALSASVSWLFTKNTDFTLFSLLFAFAAYLWMLYLKKRLSLVLCSGIFFFLALFFYLGCQEMLPVWISTVSMFILIYLVEYLYRGFSSAFVKNTADFQTQVMLHHYEEVKSVYLNMRGWRHDYHNHIQTLKAYLSLNQITEAGFYLKELEQDLKQVDQLVKSGNLMVDAILNSKLSLAKEHHIFMNCKVIAPEALPISDIDICVIIGNLMDNAIEACDELPEEERFIRVYMDIVQSQFYLSIVNAAREDLNFNQRNYISEKRGNHGNGMRRVKLTVDKYDGYLNLKNEPGVFACELMLPVDVE